MDKMEGKSHEEIVVLLGISKATIHTHMSRAAVIIKEYIRIHPRSALGLAPASAILEMAWQLL